MSRGHVLLRLRKCRRFTKANFLSKFRFFQRFVSSLVLAVALKSLPFQRAVHRLSTSFINVNMLYYNVSAYVESYFTQATYFFFG